MDLLTPGQENVGVKMAQFLGRFDRELEGVVTELCLLRQAFGLEGFDEKVPALIDVVGQRLDPFEIEQAPFLSFEADPHESATGQFKWEVVRLLAIHEPTGFQQHGSAARHRPDQG